MPGWTSADIRKMRKAGAYNPYGTLGPSPGRVQAIKPYTPPRINAPTTTPAVTPNFQTPNWAALIAGDPDYGAAEAEFNAANLMDRGNLRDAIRRAVIESGLDIGADEDVDEGTRAAARANQFSSAADIGNQLRRGAATSDAELAARGLLSSGQFTENRSVLQKGADTARNQLQNALLNTISTGRNQYASVVADRRGQLRGIRESIAARLAQNPGIWQTQQTPAAGPGAGGPASGGVNYGYGPGGTTAGETPYERALRLRSEALNKQYGLGGGGGGGGTGNANPADITGYTWQNGVQYAVMRDGRKLPASAFQGARF